MEENGILIDYMGISDLDNKKAMIVNFYSLGMDVMFDIYCFETNKIFKNCRTFIESFNRLVTKQESILILTENSGYLLIKINSK